LAVLDPAADIRIVDTRGFVSAALSVPSSAMTVAAEIVGLAPSSAGAGRISAP
jgi:hypothetical protein